MKVFLDFDDVIFNTKNFREDLINLFFENGIPRDIFEKYYRDPKDSRVIKTFDPSLQIEYIRKETGIDTCPIEKVLEKFIGDLSKYVFSDVAEFIQAIGKENIFLVSFGNLEFQTKKVHNSGIGKYLSNISITESSKARVVEEILSKEPSCENENKFFLDDRIEQIRDIKNNFPEIVTIFIKRPESRYKEMKREACCDFEAHDLDSAQDIILSLSSQK